MGGAENYKNFVSKLIKRLLLPYYLANFLWYPFLVVKEHFFGHLLKIIFYSSPIESFLGIFIGKPILLPLGPLWFLPCLLIAEIIFIKLYNRLAKMSAEIFVLAIIFAAYTGLILSRLGYLPLGLNVALVSQVFLLVGVLIRRYNFVERIDLKICGLLILTLTCAFQLNKHVNMSDAVFGDPLLFYSGAVAGTLIVMKLSSLIAGGKIFSLISDCGRQSVMILILHPLIIELFYNIFVRNKLCTLLEIYTEPLLILCMTALGVLIPLVIAENFGRLPILKYFCA